MLRIIIALFSAGLILSSCGGSQNEATSTSGVKITYLRKAENRTAPNNGDILMLNMLYQDEKGQELFNTLPQGAPVAMQYVDSIWKESGLIYEALTFLYKGDSIKFDLPAEDFFENTFNIPLPDSIRRGSNLTFFVGMVNNMNKEEYVAYQREQYMKERDRVEALMATKLEDDGATIDQYLADNNIKAETTESGLRYVITTQGKGAKPSPGDIVFVHYNGTLLDGTKFDSSYDRGQPLDFPIGQGHVIPGWDEGILLLNVGTKATLYIPSPLAYGERGAGDVIAPFSILKFDVELVSVNKQ